MACFLCLLNKVPKKALFLADISNPGSRNTYSKHDGILHAYLGRTLFIKEWLVTYGWRQVRSCKLQQYKGLLQSPLKSRTAKTTGCPCRMMHLKRPCFHQQWHKASKGRKTDFSRSHENKTGQFYKTLTCQTPALVLLKVSEQLLIRF